MQPKRSTAGLKLTLEGLRKEKGEVAAAAETLRQQYLPVGGEGF